MFQDDLGSPYVFVGRVAVLAQDALTSITAITSFLSSTVIPVPLIWV